MSLKKDRSGGKLLAPDKEVVEKMGVSFSNSRYKPSGNLAPEREIEQKKSTNFKDSRYR